MTGVSDFGQMFEESEFNNSLSQWDTSHVTSMSAMFRASVSFDQSLSNWDTSKVANMNMMFMESESFDDDLGKLDGST